ncbi:MAG: tetratricopeptide repeat protein, partial [Gemmataceae bacterium]
MPTIHKLFLFKLFCGLGLLIAALMGLHTIQAGRIPAALLRQADRAKQAHQPDAAIRYLRQYLEFRPDDVDVQEDLADLLRKRAGENTQADLLFVYDRILRMDPGRLSIRREALKLSLRHGRFADATEHAQLLLKLDQPDAETWQMLAAAQTGLRKYDEAVKSYEKAIPLHPSNLFIYQRLALLHDTDRHNTTDASRTLDRMVQANPQSAEALL